MPFMEEETVSVNPYLEDICCSMYIFAWTACHDIFSVSATSV
jgi:hypothetical protein